MQVWNVLHAARWKYMTQKWPKIRHVGTIAQLCRAVSSQLRHVSTIGKKLVKRRYLFQMSSQYGELRPTNGWDRFTSLGHHSKFWQISRLGFVTAATSLTGGQLCTIFGCLLSWYTFIYILGAFAPWQNFATCKIHFASKSCVLVTPAAGLSQTLRRGTRNGITELSQRAPLIFGWAAITLGIGPHSSCMYLRVGLYFLVVSEMKWSPLLTLLVLWFFSINSCISLWRIRMLSFWY